jgi:phage protein D
LPVDQPQLRVTIGGVVVLGAMALQVESLAYFAADRFRIDFAIGAGGIFTTGYFAGLGGQVIGIEAGLDLGYVSLLTGQIDNIRINVLKNTATLSGRDLSARMIDAEIAETFNNRTSSQIAATIAVRHGLSANVTATNTQVGQYYELDHARSALGLNARATTEWNLLTQLAQIENFALSVTGTMLNFGPPAVAAPVYLNSLDMMSLEFDMAASIPTSATVSSWSTRHKTAIKQSAGGTGGITIIRPNLTTAQANAAAANHLSALARHKTVMTAVMPGDVTLTPASQIMLSGTDTPFDQTYEIDMISRTVNAIRGFTQVVRAYALN